MSFEVLARDGAGRLGRFQTAHGAVETPALLPVINPNLDYISATEMRDRFGAQMVITNSYIIRKKAELRERALKEGVHGVLDFDGPVMTDSGTFQMYVYGQVEVAPEEIVAFQRDIGSDVGTILDIFSTPDRTREQAAEDVAETVRRAREADAIKGDLNLALTVQGGVYPELRRECAEAYQGVGDFYPIGGVVPLMEQQRYRDLVEAVVAAKRGLDPSKPVHLFGAGHPFVYPMAALMGCDFFDSASYAKYAQDDRLIYADGTRRLGEITESPCPCPVCATHTVAELRALPDEERRLRLGEHNLWVSLAEVRRVREAIRQGQLWELVEQRARAHPKLLDALKALVKHSEWMERTEPASKGSALFYSGPESAKRPEVRRFRQRLLDRFDPRDRPLLVLPRVERPFSRTYGPLVPRLQRYPVVPVVQTFLGPVPLALDATYPTSQSVAPSELDEAVAADADAFLQELATAHGVDAIPWEGEDALAERLGAPAPEDAPAWELDAERVRAIATYQFGHGAADALLDGDVELVKSRSTGRIRNVLVDGDHVLSLRASDGLYTLKAAGARRLHAALPAPRLRVRVTEESAPFNRDGKSAFAKFTTAIDPALRPGDECLVVDPDDGLVAVGQLNLTSREVGFFPRGVAASVREGVGASE